LIFLFELAGRVFVPKPAAVFPEFSPASAAVVFLFFPRNSRRPGLLSYGFPELLTPGSISSGVTLGLRSPATAPPPSECLLLSFSPEARRRPCSCFLPQPHRRACSCSAVSGFVGLVRPASAPPSECVSSTCAAGLRRRPGSGLFFRALGFCSVFVRAPAPIRDSHRFISAVAPISSRISRRQETASRPLEFSVRFSLLILVTGSLWFVLQASVSEDTPRMFSADFSLGILVLFVGIPSGCQ
jgi:hypothetical protein